MKGNNFFVFVFLFTLTALEGDGKGEWDELQFGFLDNLLKEALESLRPGLVDLYIKNQYFITGPQEFGHFSGNFSEVIIEGLDKFDVKMINTTFFDVNNLTIQEKTVCVKGLYNVNGILAFPLGKNDVRLFGDGEFGAKFTNFSISVKMKIRLDNGTNTLRDFDIIVEIDKIEVYFKELMGGGALETVFNQLINDVGLTVFNYYKEPVINTVKPEIIKFITNMLNKRTGKTKP